MPHPSVSSIEAHLDQGLDRGAGWHNVLDGAGASDKNEGLSAGEVHETARHSHDGASNRAASHLRLSQGVRQCLDHDVLVVVAGRAQFIAPLLRGPARTSRQTGPHGPHVLGHHEIRQAQVELRGVQRLRLLAQPVQARSHAAPRRVAVHLNVVRVHRVGGEDAVHTLQRVKVGQREREREREKEMKVHTISQEEK